MSGPSHVISLPGACGMREGPWATAVTKGGDNNPLKHQGNLIFFLNFLDQYKSM